MSSHPVKAHKYLGVYSLGLIAHIPVYIGYVYTQVLMMYFNPFKPLIHKFKELFLCNIPKQKKLNDEELECLQFGMCTVQVKSPRPEELFFR